jgi:hypothetical protein
LTNSQPLKKQQAKSLSPQQNQDPVSYDSIKSEFQDEDLERPSEVPLKSKKFKSWINRIRNARTLKEYKKYKKGYYRLVSKFQKKFGRRAIPPPPPKFNPVFQYDLANECQRGYSSGEKKGRNWAEKFAAGGNGAKWTLSNLMKTIPEDRNSVYSMCRGQGAREGYRQWTQLLGDKKKMKEWKRKDRLEQTMKFKRMKYYQRMEEMLSE